MQTSMDSPPDAEARRCCAVCGASLDGRRVDATVCGAACRRERTRLRSLLSGASVEGHPSLADYRERRQRRAERGIQAGSTGDSGGRRSRP